MMGQGEEALAFVAGDQGWNQASTAKNIISGFKVGKLDAEWFWVLSYGILAAVVVIANSMMFFSVGKNKFLHTNSHRYYIRAIKTRRVLVVVVCKSLHRCA